MDDEQPPAVCAWCGRSAPGPTPPMTWISSVENGRKRLFCERCARDNLRAIEGKLDSDAW